MTFCSVTFPVVTEGDSTVILRSVNVYLISARLLLLVPSFSNCKLEEFSLIADESQLISSIHL